ncbi:hypothetical protein CYY_005616 [Polysphondylium violaceum]|uniref:EGF-like domain-containing protein n=1 Tax=Polysphondylium violaceum TaxID=133409 RepID=A0A8J4Q2Q0_9MYCE|nr:hypothetical protein CYY_005616 [Polysphondylium violaceum]
MNKIIGLSLIVLFFYFNIYPVHSIPGYPFIDYSPEGTNDVFVNYLAGNVKQCNLRYNIVLSIFSNITELSCDSCASFQYSFVERNSTESLINIDIIYPYVPAQIAIPINVVGGGAAIGTFYLGFICEEPNFGIIEFVDKTLYYSYNLPSYPVFGFRVSGFNKKVAPPLTVTFTSTVSGTMTTKAISNNEYVVFVHYGYLSNDWSFFGKDFSIEISPAFSTGIVFQDSDFKSFYKIGSSESASYVVGPVNVIKDIIVNLYTVKPSRNDIFIASFIYSQNFIYPSTLVEANTSRTYYNSHAIDSASLSYNPFVVVNNSAILQNFPFTFLPPEVISSVSKTVQCLNSFVILDTKQNKYSPKFDIVTLIPGITSVPISSYQPYPFGFGSGNSSNYVLLKSYPVSPSFGWAFTLISGDDTLLYSPQVVTMDLDSEPPAIESVSVTKIPYSNLLLFTMTITDKISGFYSLEKFGDFTNVVSGSHNQVYQFIVKPYDYVRLYQGFKVCDYDSNCKKLNIFEPINLKGTIIPYSYLKLNQITGISFLYNNISTANSVENKLLIKSELIDPYLPVVMVLKDETKPDVSIDPMVYVGYWDDALQAYSISFPIVKYSAFGDFPYYLYLENQLLSYSDLRATFGPNATLKIIPGIVDIIGPMVFSLEAQANIPMTIEPSTGIIKIDSPTPGQRTLKSILPVYIFQTSFNLKITIVDAINGFKKGLLSVYTSVDLVQYNFTFDPTHLINGDKYSGVYKFDFQVYFDTCVSQDYSIYYLELMDELGHKTVYNSSFTSPNIMNPINQYYKVVASTLCTYIEDITPPALTNFTFWPSIIDPFNYGTKLNTSSRIIHFEFETYDLHKIKSEALPIIYLHDHSFQVISKRATLISNENTTAKYTCDFEIPFGFGHPYGIKASLYGIVDTRGNFNGYPVSQFPFPNAIKIQTKSTKPAIFSTSTLSPSGGFLTIYGANFFNTTIIDLEYSNLEPLDSFKPVYFNNRLIIVNNIPTLKPGYYYVTARTTSPVAAKEDSLSNSFRIVVGQDIPVYPDSSEASSSFENPPQECISNCNSQQQHGICTPKGCVCNYPWIGVDCASQVIIVDPTINTTHPETTLNDNVVNSIISIVGLNELDNSGAIINQYRFESWISRVNNNSHFSSSTNSFSYKTNITNKLDQSLTEIYAFIDYFNQSTPTNITFANQLITMNPHSLKYSINITSYSFSNSLNTLQLVLSASIENENGECSASSTGNNVESNSEFIKLQVNDNSLYGRFIKRGIVDGRVKAVTNQILKDSEFFQSTSTQSRSQAFIGINIPQYKRMVELDPDFSIIVDTRSAAESDNSICLGKKKSKLSTAQLAGIIVACVAVSAAIVTSTVYYLYKKKKENIENQRVAAKLKTLESPNQ